ncbi:MAG: hypothetical protein J7L54_04020 [Elusimicrobia bacterium]|nr:hypothetical protein [Elusimicrobiota bacterium]
MEKLLDVIVKDLTENFDDIVAAVLFGSACDETYEKGKSDINVCVVKKEIDPPDLKTARRICKNLKRKDVSFLFLTERHIDTSADSYPLELLDIQQRHRLLLGENIFENLEFKNEDIRLQCERQIKGLRIHLYRIYIKGLNPKKMTDIAKSALKTIAFCMKGMLFTSGIALFSNPISEVIGKFGEIFSFDCGIFSEVAKARRISEDFFLDFIEKVEQLGILTDRAK